MRKNYIKKQLIMDWDLPTKSQNVSHSMAAYGLQISVNQN